MGMNTSLLCIVVVNMMSVTMTGLNTVKEEKFTKLKASYLKLRDEHVQLLREEGDVRKQLTSLQAVVIQEDTSKKVMCHIYLHSILCSLLGFGESG